MGNNIIRVNTMFEVSISTEAIEKQVSAEGTGHLGRGHTKHSSMIWNGPG